MIELILAVALAQPCMIPKAHHHHKVVKPLTTCITPRAIIFTAPEPDIEPIPVPLVVTKFVVPLAVNAAPLDCDMCDMGWGYSSGGYYGVVGGGASPSTPPTRSIEPKPSTPTRPLYVSYPVPTPRAPEIDGGSAPVEITLLAGLLVVIRKGKIR